MTSGACSRLTLVLLCAAALCAGAVLGALGELLRASLAVPRRWYGRVLTVALVALLLAAPVAAQPGSEDEPIPAEVLEEEVPEIPAMEVELGRVVAEEEEAEEPAPSRLQAAVWCPVLERRREQLADQLPDGEGGEQGQSDERVEQLRCDVGLGFALYSWRTRQGKWSVVGVVGAQSLGPGLGWTFGEQIGRPISVAFGIVVPFDSAGIYRDEWALAVGVTAAVFGRR